MSVKKDFKWYVLKSISGKEAKVKEYIETAMKTAGWDEYVSQVLIPMEKVRSNNNKTNKRAVKERNMLPGYVLIEAIITDESYPILRRVPNVIGFVTDRKSVYPTPVRQSEINKIMGSIEQVESNYVSDVTFEVGETIKVNDGPFTNFKGEVSEVSADKNKLKVVVTVFGRKTPLELGFNQVDKE